MSVMKTIAGVFVCVLALTAVTNAQDDTKTGKELHLNPPQAAEKHLV